MRGRTWKHKKPKDGQQDQDGVDSHDHNVREGHIPNICGIKKKAMLYENVTIFFIQIDIDLNFIRGDWEWT